MAITLETLVNGDTNYIAKHNRNYAAIQSAVNDIFTNYQPRSEAGQPGGYAVLDPSGKVGMNNLPQEFTDGSYQRVAEKNQPNGYCGLDASGRIPVAAVPIDWAGMDNLVDQFQRVSEKGQANGYCELDPAGLIPINRLPPGEIVLWQQADIIGGFPKIDSTTGKIQDRWLNLPNYANYQAVSEKGRPSGYVPLDSDARIPVTMFNIPGLKAALGLPP